MSGDEKGLLVEMPVRGFLDELASASPAPGGGSVAALAGAIAAALTLMVSRLTIGREKFRAQEETMRGALGRAEDLRHRLLALVDKDTEAFLRVISAYRMPKGTDAEKRARAQAVQRAVVAATEVPLEVAALSLEALEMAAVALEHGNPNTASDAGVAFLMALAGARGASLNVRINLDSIDDEVAREKLRHRLDKVLAQVDEFESKISRILKSL